MNQIEDYGARGWRKQHFDESLLILNFIGRIKEQS